MHVSAYAWITSSTPAFMQAMGAGLAKAMLVTLGVSMAPQLGALMVFFAVTLLAGYGTVASLKAIAMSCDAAVLRHDNTLGIFGRHDRSKEAHSQNPASWFYRLRQMGQVFHGLSRLFEALLPMGLVALVTGGVGWVATKTPSLIASLKAGDVAAIGGTVGGISAAGLLAWAAIAPRSLLWLLNHTLAAPYWVYVEWRANQDLDTELAIDSPSLFMTVGFNLCKTGEKNPLPYWPTDKDGKYKSDDPRTKAQSKAYAKGWRQSTTATWKAFKMAWNNFDKTQRDSADAFCREQRGTDIRHSSMLTILQEGLTTVAARHKACKAVIEQMFHEDSLDAIVTNQLKIEASCDRFGQAKQAVKGILIYEAEIAAAEHCLWEHDLLQGHGDVLDRTDINLEMAMVAKLQDAAVTKKILMKRDALTVNDLNLNAGGGVTPKFQGDVQQIVEEMPSKGAGSLTDDNDHKTADSTQETLHGSKTPAPESRAPGDDAHHASTGPATTPGDGRSS